MKNILILLLTLVFFGCANLQVNNLSIGTKHMKLQDKEYKILKIINKINNKEYQAFDGFSIIIEKNNFGMFIGCNKIFGQTTIVDSKINFFNVGTTKMMCPTNMMELEDFVLKNLNTLNIVDNGFENDNLKIVLDDFSSK